jgi:hypothetical protein
LQQAINIKGFPKTRSSKKNSDVLNNSVVLQGSRNEKVGQIMTQQPGDSAKTKHQTVSQKEFTKDRAHTQLENPSLFQARVSSPGDSTGGTRTIQKSEEVIPRQRSCSSQINSGTISEPKQSVQNYNSVVQIKAKQVS